VLDFLDAKTGRRLVLDDEALIDENRFSYGLALRVAWASRQGRDLVARGGHGCRLKISKKTPLQSLAERNLL
jgi:hypothetical protein